MRRKIIGPALFCLALVVRIAHGEEDEFLSWLKDPVADVQHTQCTTNLLTSACTNIVYLEFSPDRNHYFILQRTPEIQCIELFEWGSTNKTQLYSHRGMPENKFLPSYATWYPDADKINVSYFHEDLRVVHNFEYDVQTGKLAQNDEERFKQLEVAAGKDRPSDIRFSDEAPVWSLGGKKFAREVEVERAGYALFEPWRIQRPNPNVLIRWNNEVKYELFPRRYHKEICVMKGDEFVGNAICEYMYQGVIFINADGILITKVLPVYSMGKKTISFGERKLETVSSLGDKGILIQTTDGTNNYWDVLDPRQWDPSKNW